MSNQLPYKHIQEQTERQLLNIIVDKLCCISENTTANNEYKIAYYQEISDTTGTITIPTGATILLNQLAGGADALVSTIDGVPTGSLPQTAGGVQVDVTSFDSSGNYVLSGTPSSYPVALIYWLKISAADYPNLDINNIIEENVPILVDNIYTADGTLTGDRTLDLDANTLEFTGGSGAQLRLSDADAVNDYVDFEVNPAGNLKISPSGDKVGIGISPSYSLHVFSPTQSNVAYFQSGGGAATILLRDAGTTSTNAISFGTDGDNLRFITQEGDITYSAATGDVTAERMRVVGSTGNVGIGTSSPSARLHADNTETTGVGAIIENSDATNTGDIAQFHNSTGTVASIDNDGDLAIDTYIYNQGETKAANGTSYIRLYKNTSTQGRIRLIGDDNELDIWNANYIRLRTNNATTQNLLVNVANAANTNPIAEFQKEGTTVASITNDGYITAQAATGTSDTVAIWDGTTLKKKELIIETGTYTPTFSDFVEVTSITNLNTRYNRVGNIVTVYCDMLFTATTANVSQTFKMTLPISSNLTSSNDLTGTMTYALGTGTPPAHGIITGDSTNDKADVTIRVSRTDNRRSYIIFTYEIK